MRSTVTLDPIFTSRIGDKVKSIALMCGYFGGRPSDNKGNVYTRPDGSEINGIWPLELPAFLISCEKNLICFQKQI